MMRLLGHCSPSIKWSSGPTAATARALVGSKRRYAVSRRKSCAILLHTEPGHRGAREPRQRNERHAGVMGKNWVHQQNGSGEVAKETHDIAMTSPDEALIGATIVFRGGLTAWPAPPRGAFRTPAAAPRSTPWRQCARRCRFSRA
jgi:hypothetical protein